MEWVYNNRAIIFLIIVSIHIVSSFLINSQKLKYVNSVFSSPANLIFHWFVHRALQKFSPKNFQPEKTQEKVIINGLSFALYAIIIIIIYQILSSGSLSSEGFTGTFLIALLEDIFFFGAIGLGIFYISSNKPGKHDPVARLGYLLNSDKVTPEIRKRIFENVSARLIYCRKMTLSINFTEYCPNVSAVRVVSNNTKKFFNPLADIDIMTDEHPFEIFTDNIQKLGNFHRIHNNNAEFITIAVKHEHNKDDDDLLTAPITVPKGNASRKYKINSPGGSEYETKFKFWVWHKVGKYYVWNSKRYTEILYLTLKNSTNEENTEEYNIKIKLIIDKLYCAHSNELVTDLEIILTPGEERKYYLRDLSDSPRNIYKLISSKRI